MMSRHCSGLTTGFLKKLPALPITAGSGSLARRMAHTQSKTVCASGAAVAGLGHLAFQIQVAQHRLPGPRQAQAHARDDGLARQVLLEDAVAVAEAAGRGVQRHACGRSPGPPRPATRSGPSAPRRRRRCSAPAPRPPSPGSAPGSPAPASPAAPSRPRGRARSRRRRPRRSRRRASVRSRRRPRISTFSTTPGRSRVRTTLLPPPSTNLGATPYSGWSTTRRTSASLASRTSVAATAGRPKLLCSRRLARCCTWSVFGAVGHGRILVEVYVPPLPLPPHPPMPSFDTVIEPDLVELRNAVDQANKEIGTRFDFKGSSAADRTRRPQRQGPRADAASPTATSSSSRCATCCWRGWPSATSTSASSTSPARRRSWAATGSSWRCR